MLLCTSRNTRATASTPSPKTPPPVPSPMCTGSCTDTAILRASPVLHRVVLALHTVAPTAAMAPRDSDTGRTMWPNPASTAACTTLAAPVALTPSASRTPSRHAATPPAAVIMGGVCGVWWRVAHARVGSDFTAISLTPGRTLSFTDPPTHTAHTGILSMKVKASVTFPSLLACVLGITVVLATPVVPIKDDSHHEFDCGKRRLMYEFALKTQPWRLNTPTSTFARDVFDGLQLGARCGDAAPAPALAPHPSIEPHRAEASLACCYVEPALNVAANAAIRNGSISAPFVSVHSALDRLRELRATAAGGGQRYHTIVLRGGVHFIGNNGSLELTPADSGITIEGHPGEDAWLSGGVALTGLQWQPATLHPNFAMSGGSIMKASLKEHPTAASSGVSGLFTLDKHIRVAHSRLPAIDVERDQWGYSSPNRDKYALNSNMVMEWTKPTPADQPSYTVIDLSDPNNPTGFVKNNSQMPGYNTFVDGVGGACNTVWKDHSYWCSNASAGGWAEVDFHAAMAGQLQIPVGMTWNKSVSELDVLQSVTNLEGAIVHAWHSQTWAMHFFEISKFDVEEAKLEFAPYSGSQGGRNWCRCDQCGYAAGLWSNNGNWCERTGAQKDTRLIGGSWAIENFAEGVSVPGSYFYNASTKELFVWPNASWPLGSTTLVTPVLQQLVVIKGTSKDDPITNVTIKNIGFRDAKRTYLERWSAPSGGDWALHRSGAVFASRTVGTAIHNCTFRRLDGTAIMFSDYNRDGKVMNSTFEFIGNSAMAGWGTTDGWDGRSGDQPRGTLLAGNLVRDIGLFQKQSSSWFQARTAQTTLRDNIFFNQPRAAINFNDGFGGGNEVDGNLIFNTCTQSGDHGPINSWDRLPFLTDVSGKPTFDPVPTKIWNNVISADNGAAQAVDNDDGSSFYFIHNNVFVEADGFKMDYGGHGSVFADNFVVTKLSRGQCIGVGPFKSQLGDTFENNTCVLLGIGVDQSVGGVAQCDPAFMTMGHNTYVTPTANATMSCGRRNIPIADLYNITGVGKLDTVQQLPPDKDLVAKLARRIALL
eukprot:m.132554 g.132554  ORF g.132554 m.132554 type:complete len:1047 (+) comp16850_c0_seq2:1130-4270(+)